MIPSRILCGLAIVGATVAPAFASGTINYGSRAGMEVSVVSMSGLDGPNASIRTKHTRENATTFCREYAGKVTKKCVDEELATRLNDEIHADCRTGRFVDFSGTEYQFMGPNKEPDVMAKYAIKDISTGEIADGSSASGYSVSMGIYKALCPSKAPQDD